VFMSCNGSNPDKNNMDSTSVTTVSSVGDTAKMVATSTLDDMSSKFVTDAAEGGMMEVDLGNAAIKIAMAQSVKDFGKMMVDDHTLLNNSLKDIAMKKNVQVPAAITSGQQSEMDDLTKKTGKDFDKAYVNMMVDDHKKDIDDFTKASENLTDPELKTFATNALPVLKKHLQAIEAIQRKM
ncbi:MAG: DUF4142 domain-containing protein, partial [Ginsengibacter sp.]